MPRGRFVVELDTRADLDAFDGLREADERDRRRVGDRTSRPRARSSPNKRATSSLTALKISAAGTPSRHQRRDAAQRGLLVGEQPDGLLRIRARDRDAHELAESLEARLGTRRQRLGRRETDRPPQAVVHGDRARNRGNEPQALTRLA